MRQQPTLAFQAATKPGQRSIGPDNPVAGNDHRYRIGTITLARFGRGCNWLLHTVQCCDMPIKKQRSTPKRRESNATAARIVLAAREILMDEGHAQFSMRNVAARAGVHLNNVQYYFKTREHLVRALLEDTGSRYRASYDKLLAFAPADPAARFDALIEFNLQDVSTWETRRFFIQLWALLITLDGRSGSFLDDLYAIDIEQLSGFIAELVPGTAPAEIRRRASVLAAMIEGMVVMRGAHSRNASELKRLMARARAVAKQIAFGRIPEE
jgi:AcrR family transcriptional regulator